MTGQLGFFVFIPWYLTFKCQTKWYYIYLNVTSKDTNGTKICNSIMLMSNDEWKELTSHHVRGDWLIWHRWWIKHSEFAIIVLVMSDWCVGDEKYVLTTRGDCWFRYQSSSPTIILLTDSTYSHSWFYIRKIHSWNENL